ncbi:unnamed protein product, partial [Allacma fusca]
PTIDLFLKAFDLDGVRVSEKSCLYTLAGYPYTGSYLVEVEM